MTRVQAIRFGSATAAGVSALLFAALAFEIVSGTLQPVDDAIRAGVHSYASDELTSVAEALSFVGSATIWPVLSIVAVALFWRLAWRHAAVDLIIIMTGAVILENILKYFFARIRPEPYFGVAPASYSFPSGHALYAACLYGVLACSIAARTRGVLSGAAALTIAAFLIGGIGLSRIYLGVHYPSDVAAGYLVAVFWIGVVALMRATNEK